MAYLSRLRNPETDNYEHHGMIAVFGQDQAEEALRRSHVEVMMSMLNLSILDQVDDVRKYLESLPQSSKRLLANWDKTKGYETFLPPTATLAQRELFDGNMAVIIRHLRGEHASDGQRPG